MTGKRRLKVLANYLLSGAVDDEKFDMGDWAHCAIGEGANLPSLEKDGLALVENNDGDLAPEYNGSRAYEACAEFFAIPYDKARAFFGPTKRSAARVGRQLLRYLIE